MNSSIAVRISITMMIFIIIGAGTVFGAEIWYPFEFENFERFEYRVSWKDGSQTYEAYYILDIQEGDGSDFLVSYTTKMDLDRNEFRGDRVFDVIEKYPPALWHGFIGASPELLFEGVKLEEGEHTLYPKKYSEIMEKIDELEEYGFEEEAQEAREEIDIEDFPVINIVGKEEVGERTGFIGELRERKTDEEAILELVIDPELPLPIRVNFFDRTETEVVLVEYEKY